MKVGQIANKKVISTFVCCMCFLLVLYCTLSQINIKEISAGRLKASTADLLAQIDKQDVIDKNETVSKFDGIEEKKIVVINGFEGVELQYSDYYYVSSSPLTASRGALYYNGHKETYYSERVLPGNGLNIPGRHAADDGTIRDWEGYIVVAADPSFASRGTTLMTSMGPAKVYDTGCAYGTIDIYVNW